MASKKIITFNALRYARIRALILAVATILSVAGMMWMYSTQEDAQQGIVFFMVATALMMVLIGILSFAKFQDDLFSDGDKVELVRRYGPFKSIQFQARKEEIQVEITQDQKRYYIANLVLGDGTRIQIDRNPTEDRILEVVGIINDGLK